MKILKGMEIKMKIEQCKKESFAVIGKRGSTEDGDNFISELWGDANAHFHQVEHLAKKDKNGNIVGIWGAMSDFSHAYKPWEDNFSKGLYLAGVECEEDAKAPDGWEKWQIPGYEYFYAECDSDDIFSKMIAHLNSKGIELAGAALDFTCPTTGKNYIFFPIHKL